MDHRRPSQRSGPARPRGGALEKVATLLLVLSLVGVGLGLLLLVRGDRNSAVWAFCGVGVIWAVAAAVAARASIQRRRFY